MIKIIFKNLEYGMNKIEKQKNLAQYLGFSQMALVVKNLPANEGVQETQVQSLGQEDPLEQEMALHWKIPWAEEPGGLQSIGLQRVGHD